MQLVTYGKSTGFCIDPIEKKPLNHFLPGTSVLSFGTAGCNLGCKFCQNWDISKSKEIEILSQNASPEEIASSAKRMNCRSLAFTYNDPVIWAEYAIDCAKAGHDQGLKSVAVTAGYITPEARPDFFSVMDAANVDLKGFTEAFYHDITLSSLEPVLDTLRWLKHESDVWFEITNLIIPDHNDSLDEIARMSDWIVRELGTDVPVHFTAFHPDYKLTDKPRTPPETLRNARERARQAGLKFVYVGNVDDKSGQSTYCPQCGECVIERRGYDLGAFRIKDGACSDCGTKIPGLFENQAGSWGSRRDPLAVRDGKIVSRSAMISYTPKTDFNPTEQSALLEHAFGTLAEALGAASEPASLPPALEAAPTFGIFTTLSRGSLLRGCRGRWGTDTPAQLGEVLRACTKESALEDPRFPRVHASELPFMELELSIMYEPNGIAARGQSRLNAFVPGEHGLALLHPSGRALLLPQVATEARWDSLMFLRQLSLKAGLSADAWSEDETNLISFKVLLLTRPAESSEVDVGEIDGEILQQTVSLTKALLSGHQGEMQLRSEFLQRATGVLGVQIRTTDGRSVTSIGEGRSLLQLVGETTRALSAGKTAPPVTTLEECVVLSQPILLQPTDNPTRFGSALGGPVLAESQSGRALVFPKGGNFVAEALQLSGGSAQSWREGTTLLRSFRSRSQRTRRSSAFAGSFYPAAPEHSLEALQRLLSRTQGTRVARAILLPHAGWRFCGKVAAAALDQVRIPDRVVIIGPKHTSFGSERAIAPEESWEIPGGEVRIDEALRKKFAATKGLLELDGDAHRQEHGAEVLIPFLVYKNPNVRVLPIAIGRIAYDECLRIGEILRILSDEGNTLVVLSSDMNHFADETENRRRDSLALQAFAKGDARALLSVCTTENISMCGLLPAVAVLHAFRDTRKEICAYDTSATVTGDRTRVVGYASAIL